MARLRRMGLPGVPQHAIQRGNNRVVCFGAEEDFAAYAYWLDEYSREYGVAIHAWLFMIHHVHLLLTPAEDDSVSRMMQSLRRSYDVDIKALSPERFALYIAESALLRRVSISSPS